MQPWQMYIISMACLSPVRPGTIGEFLEVHYRTIETRHLRQADRVNASSNKALRFLRFLREKSESANVSTIELRGSQPPVTC